MSTPTDAAIDALYERLLREAKAGGYNVNPDVPFTRMLLEGLLQNAARYGYQACPCRLAGGQRAQDLDLICPCDYRDDDLHDYGACYCALYVSDAIARGEAAAEPIPERRAPGGPAHDHEHEWVPAANLPFPVWRCNVCGYLCARTAPPAKCPICHVTTDRFTRFL